MAEETEVEEPWAQLEALIETRNIEELHAFLDTLSPGDIARAMSRLDEADKAELLALLDPEDAAHLIEELSDMQGAELIDDLPAHQAALIIEELDSDHRADLLGELATRDAEAILQRMDPEEAEEARTLMEHGRDTAGGLMVTEFVVYPQNLTVGDVLNDLRTNAEAYSDYGVQYAYVCSETGRLVGVLRLRDLVLSPNERPLSKVMIANPISVHVDTPLEELEQAFDRYQFSGLPVVETDGGIVGVVQRVDVEEALSERAEQVFMRFSGIFGGDELRHLPLTNRSMRRLWWLGVNLTLSFVSASIIVLFQDTISHVIALAALIPILANVSGCSGNQAVAVSIRELTLGIVKPSDLFRVILQEVSVGLLNGFVLGLILGAVVYGWKHSVALAFVVAISLNVNMAVAVVLGGSIPLVMKRLGVDPAVASPMLSTFVDMCGFFVILSLATALLL